VTTDLVRATIDSIGGTLVRLELLKQAESVESTEHVVLFDSSPTRLYLAETGLVPPQGGGGLPNHHTPMRIVPGERSLASGANELKVVLESEAVGGVKLGTAGQLIVALAPAALMVGAVVSCTVIT